MTGHVIICGWDPITQALAKRLVSTGVPYVTLASDVDEVRRLEQEGVSVIHGRPSDAHAFVRARVGGARMVIANSTDGENANIALTVASISATPVAALLTESSRAGLLALAGVAHTVPLRELLGGYLAVRATTKGAKSHVVDSLGDLLFAEIASYGTPFVGLTLREADIRQRTGTSVVAIWQRGRFTIPRPDTEITDKWSCSSSVRRPTSRPSRS
jgi:Trk K+ transport system NAD-binding subunit